MDKLLIGLGGLVFLVSVLVLRRVFRWLSVLLLVGLWVGSAAAQPIAGDQTIAQFRARNDLARQAQGYQIADYLALEFASGVMSFQNVLVECQRPVSVGELKAFLLYTAKPEHRIKQALFEHLDRHGCALRSTEDVAKDLAR